ncbi:hypothetical protein CA11_45450 [Gimesia maris]|nr:hypothetical protein CA11_45450 [Gimesia maris]
MFSNLKNCSPSKVTAFSLLFFLLLNGVYYQLIDLNIEYLKAESGVFLMHAAKSPEESKAFFDEYVYSAYHAHFTPVVFLAEYYQSKLFATCETCWYWRQIFVASLFMSCIVYFSIRLSMTGKELTHPNWQRNLTGLAIAIVFGFQPIISTLIGWPFMGIQFLCLSVSLFSFLYLFEFTQSGRRLHLYLALGLAYLTMHIFGTGLAISLSVLFTATLLITLKWSQTSDDKLALVKSFIPVFVVSALTLGHTYLMLKGELHTDAENVSFFTSITRYGAILIEFLHTSLRYIWAQGGCHQPEMRGMETDSIYGWGLVIIVLITIFSSINTYLKKPSDELLMWISILTLPTITLLIIVAMITYRIQSEPSHNVIIGYINTDRYLIFSSFCGLVYCLGLFLRSNIKITTSVAAAFCIAAVFSIAGNAVFMHKVPHIVWPEKSISHEEYWNEILHSVQANPDHQNASWNQSMSVVTVFDLTPLDFQALIEKQLKLQNSAESD